MIPIQGTWEIKDYKRISDIQENHDTIADSKKLLGKTALFTYDGAKVVNESCSEAQYQIRRVNTRDYFLFHYNIDAQELNIDKATMEIISITSGGILFFDIG